RRRHDEIGAVAREREAETREQRANRFGCNVDAEEPLDARRAYAHGVARWQHAGDVAERARASAANVQHQLSCALDRACTVAEVDAALEAKAGIACKAQAARAPLNHRGIPERAFEQHRRRRVADPGMLATHDAGE